MKLLHWISHLELSGSYAGEWDVGQLRPIPAWTGSMNEINETKNQTKNIHEMKSKQSILKWLATLVILFGSMTGAWGQVEELTIPGNETVCLNSTHNYGVTNHTGSIYTWTLSGGGTITGNTNRISINWTAIGTYTLQVVERNDLLCTGEPVVISVIVESLPVIALAGDQDVCLNSTGNVYTTEANMTNYVWTVVGGTITSGGSATDNTVTITWTGTGAQSVSVNYTNPNGCTAANPATLPVQVQPLPVPTITGPSPVCATITGSVYITEANMTNYVWGISTGGTITAGQGTNSITVTWNTAGAQNVSVNYNDGNGCTASTPTVLPVIINALPATSAIYHD
jgi:hypothetical protein